MPAFLERAIISPFALLCICYAYLLQVFESSRRFFSPPAPCLLLTVVSRETFFSKNAFSLSKVAEFPVKIPKYHLD
jgi:hypothetical protein